MAAHTEHCGRLVGPQSKEVPSLRAARLYLLYALTCSRSCWWGCVWLESSDGPRCSATEPAGTVRNLDPVSLRAIFALCIIGIGMKSRNRALQRSGCPRPWPRRALSRRCSMRSPWSRPGPSGMIPRGSTTSRREQMVGRLGRRNACWRPSASVTDHLGIAPGAAADRESRSASAFSTVEPGQLHRARRGACEPFGNPSAALRIWCTRA